MIKVWLSLTIITFSIYLPIYFLLNDSVEELKGLNLEDVVELQNANPSGVESSTMNRLLREARDTYNLDIKVDLDKAIKRNKNIDSYEIYKSESNSAKVFEQQQGIATVILDANLSNSVRLIVTFGVYENACSQYAKFFMFKKQKALETLQKLYAGDPENPFKPVVIEKLAGDIGQYPVVTRMDQMLCSSAQFPSPEFEHLLNRGFKLKQDTRITEADVDRFEKELSAANVEEQLAWLGPWLRADCLYRAERFADAFEHSKKAYMLGKYRTGRNQYHLVKQYMDLCAKTDRRLKFKQVSRSDGYALKSKPKKRSIARLRS